MFFFLVLQNFFLVSAAMLVMGDGGKNLFLAFAAMQVMGDGAKKTFLPVIVAKA